VKLGICPTLKLSHVDVSANGLPKLARVPASGRRLFAPSSGVKFLVPSHHLTSSQIYLHQSRRPQFYQRGCPRCLRTHSDLHSFARRTLVGSQRCSIFSLRPALVTILCHCHVHQNFLRSQSVQCRPPLVRTPQLRRAYQSNSSIIFDGPYF